MSNTNFHGVMFDQDLILDNYTRTRKEILELARRMTALNEAIHHMRMMKTPNEKMQAFYKLTADKWDADVDSYLEDIIFRYDLMKKEKNG